MRFLSFWRAEMLICLPLVITLATAFALFMRVVPHVREAEEKRVLAAYREYADDVREDLNAPDIQRLPRGANKALGRLGTGSWGLVEQDEKPLVWYRPARDENIYARPVTRVTRYNVVRNMMIVSVVILVMIIILTDLGLRLYRRYVRVREDFIAATVHDLTTPLAALRYAIGTDDDAAHDLNEHMLRLIANLREFLRLGGKRPLPTLVPVDLRAAYRQAYRFFQADYRDLWEGKDIALASTEETPLMVWADETQLQQILWNLLGNDLKYAAPFGMVSAAFARTGDRVTFVLRDTGRGMTARQRRLAFSRYYRAQTVMTSGRGGFGIGLTIAREAVRSFGGDLTVAANSPHGCVFTLTLRAAEGKERTE